MAGAAIAFFAGTGRTPFAQADRSWALNVQSLASPAGDNSSEPQVMVTGSRTILSWVEKSGVRATLKFAERTASGWSMPRVVIAGEKLILNASDVPSVRALTNGTLAAQWLEDNGSGDPEAYDLKVSMSKDGGATWSAPVSPHHDGTKTQHGFASLYELPNGGLGLIWLDGRKTNPEEEGAAFGNMSLRSAAFGIDGVQKNEVAVDARVCDCCPTSVAATSTGVIIAYRDRSPAEIRDIAVRRLEVGRWSPPVMVHNDGWKVLGCPVNGPSISAHEKDVAVAWFTTQKNEGKVLVAFSHDTGRTFGQPIRVDEQGALGRVSVDLLSDGSAAVAWVEVGQAPPSHFKVRRVEQSGARSAAIVLADSGGTRIPRMARVNDELVFAWTATKDGATNVLTSHAKIPK
jgi:hypothetical protein